jgi:hypothetical protein
MTLPAGRSYVQQTLAGLLGITFTHRSRYWDSCSRNSTVNISCGFGFSSGPTHYYGNVTVYYVRYSNGVAEWSDTYTVHGVNDHCYFHSGHRTACRVHSKHGTW